MTLTTAINRERINGGMNGNHAVAAALGFPGVKQEKDYHSILKANQITIDESIELPPVCIEIGSNGNHSTIGTLGNISLIMAKAKQGKTFAVTILLSAVVNNASFQSLIRASLPANQNKAILFDTEQSRFHVQRVLKRVCHLSGIEQPTNLMVYSLRSLTPTERLELIEYALYNTSNIGFVVIDGIRDLISSINDEEQSTMITSKLLKWTEDLNIHIMTVLHQNKADSNARGHLGTELVNKAETVLSISKSSDDKEVSVVQPEYCRDKEFEPFAFRIDEHGVPYILESWTSSANAEKAKKIILLPGQIAESTHAEILKDVFAVEKDPKYSELLPALKNRVNSWYGFNVADARIREYIQYYIDRGLIIKVGKTPHTKYLASASTGPKS